MRLIVLGAVLGVAVSLLGILAMTGNLRLFLSPQLSAEVHLTEYPLPSGFGLEPQIVADFLVQELVDRATSDIALRLALGAEGQKRMIEIGIPRLVNSVVVRDMIKNIKPLANVLSVGDFRIAARVVVENRDAARRGIALTLPGAILVEAESGSAAIKATSTGLTAIDLGDMAAGESRVLNVWLGQAAVDAGSAIGGQMLLGDANGEAGRVWIYGQELWQGADLQAMPFARWAIGGVLMVVFVASLLTLVLTALARLGVGRPRRVNLV
jgi:hypothetical protein